MGLDNAALIIVTIFAVICSGFLLLAFLTSKPVLQFIGKRMKHRVIKTPDGLDYLTRHYIYKSPNKKIFLHRFHRSDGDRDLHDHPWPFTTFILNSGYMEHLPEGVRKIGRWSLVSHKPEDQHSVELLKDKDGKEIEAWTLVVVGKKTREWGFQTPTGWKPYTEYFDLKFGKGNWNEEKEVIAMNQFMEE